VSNFSLKSSIFTVAAFPEAIGEQTRQSDDDRDRDENELYEVGLQNRELSAHCGINDHRRRARRHDCVQGNRRQIDRENLSRCGEMGREYPDPRYDYYYRSDHLRGLSHREFHDVGKRVESQFADPLRKNDRLQEQSDRSYREPPECRESDIVSPFDKPGRSGTADDSRQHRERHRSGVLRSTCDRKIVEGFGADKIDRPDAIKTTR
jgi:hypothetical protein